MSCILKLHQTIDQPKRFLPGFCCCCCWCYIVRTHTERLWHHGDAQWFFKMIPLVRLVYIFTNFSAFCFIVSRNKQQEPIDFPFTQCIQIQIEMQWNTTHLKRVCCISSALNTMLSKYLLWNWNEIMYFLLFFFREREQNETGTERSNLLSTQQPNWLIFIEWSADAHTTHQTYRALHRINEHYNEHDDFVDVVRAFVCDAFCVLRKSNKQNNWSHTFSIVNINQNWQNAPRLSHYNCSVSLSIATIQDHKWLITFLYDRKCFRYLYWAKSSTNFNFHLANIDSICCAFSFANWQTSSLRFKWELKSKKFIEERQFFFFSLALFFWFSTLFSHELFQSQTHGCLRNCFSQVKNNFNNIHFHFQQEENNNKNRPVNSCSCWKRSETWFWNCGKCCW